MADQQRRAAAMPLGNTHKPDARAFFNPTRKPNILLWISWHLLQQAKARNLPAIRRKDNELWRRKLYASIFAIAKKNLGWSDEDIHAFASLKLGKAVSSLKDVGERDLTKIVRLIRAESRKK